MSTSKNTKMDRANITDSHLLKVSAKELKKIELVSVLAGLIKNYAEKKQQK